MEETTNVCQECGYEGSEEVCPECGGEMVAADDTAGEDSDEEDLDLDEEDL